MTARTALLPVLSGVLALVIGGAAGGATGYFVAQSTQTLSSVGPAGEPGVPGVAGEDGRAIISAAQIDIGTWVDQGTSTQTQGEFQEPWNFNPGTLRGPGSEDFVVAANSATVTVPAAGWYRITYLSNCNTAAAGARVEIRDGAGHDLVQAACNNTGALGNQGLTTHVSLAELNPDEPLSLTVAWVVDKGNWYINVAGTLILERLT